MNPDRIPTLIIFGCLIICIFLLDNKISNIKSTEETRYCHIDSISVRRRYEVMPQLDKTYWTDCGVFPAGNTNHQIGDSIEIKIIRYETTN